jgi:hypothetical protein
MNQVLFEVLEQYINKNKAYRTPLPFEEYILFHKRRVSHKCQALANKE